MYARNKIVVPRMHPVIRAILYVQRNQSKPGHLHACESHMKAAKIYQYRLSEAMAANNLCAQGILLSYFCLYDYSFPVEAYIRRNKRTAACPFLRR